MRRMITFVPMMERRDRHIELLAPARDFATGRDAVDFGADAVYIGGPKFGARRGAVNATEEIERLVRYARPYGVRVYATLNTILYDRELEEARRIALDLIAAGVSALIIQDFAYLRMDLPPVELHASTQMHNMSVEQAVFLSRCGFSRIILERALTLEEIARIAQATDAEIECFVHGAICVGYSGRCFLSRSMSSRSGNRGACSQPCRLTYDLTDGRGGVIRSGLHLLSVQDLNLSAHIPELLDAGVDSFKIEGRLKDAVYIRNAVACYRRVIDEALAERPDLKRASAGRSLPDFTPDLSRSFQRGETTFFFHGLRSGVASFDTPKSFGRRVGRVARVDREGFVLEPGGERLASGDGICFFSGGRLVGTGVNRVDGDRVVPASIEGIVRGTDIYRNFDRLFVRQVEQSRTRRTVGVRVTADRSRDRIVVRYVDEEGLSSEAEWTGCFEEAEQSDKAREMARQQLSRSGDTIFRVEEVALKGVDIFVPVAVWNELRRTALARLYTIRSERILPSRIRQEESVAWGSKELTASDNVTNHLSERFWRDHGVVRFERGLDLEKSLRGRCVMRSRYCIRREIGACLREHPRLQGDLYLERGSARYRLEFDCARCEMKLIDEKIWKD